jgi:sugar phosphate isomerase/epimerase
MWRAGKVDRTSLSAQAEDQPMTMTRRAMLAACAGALPAFGWSASHAADTRSEGQRLGIVSESFAIRRAVERSRGAEGFRDPLVFLEHCHELGAGGAQLDIGRRDKAYVAKLRMKLDACRLYLEGSIGLPRDRTDTDRFDSEVRTAKAAGATVLRTFMLGGRRYETFATNAAFHEWADRSFQSLVLAEAIAARHDVRLAVENHKDWRIDELTAILKRIDSRHVGVCVDTGNSIALLENPMEVVEAYAPWAFSTHLKDMAVAEYDEGFLLAEVPLGEGFLDLKRMVAVLRKARPEIHFNLEMITRNPLKIPCLTPKYWATFESLPGRYLAQTLAMVRKHASRKPLPRVSELSQERQLAVEEKNVRVSLSYAKKELAL